MVKNEDIQQLILDELPNFLNNHDLQFIHEPLEVNEFHIEWNKSNSNKNDIAHLRIDYRMRLLTNTKKIITICGIYIPASHKIEIKNLSLGTVVY